MRHNKGVMTLYVCLYCSDISYSPMIDFNENQPEGLAIGGHASIKFNFETKKYVKFHSKTEGYANFHSDTKGYANFHSDTKG
jgi:hypothetical protein